MEFKLSEIESAARFVIEQARARRSSDHATVIIFSGDLGAGKTTLIQEIGRQLGVAESMQSPTFVIYKRYTVPPRLLAAIGGTPTLAALGPISPLEGNRPYEGGDNVSEVTIPWKYLIHGDMYRLESPGEILELGWDDLLVDPGNLICVEWPEKVVEVIPSHALRVVLEHGENEGRKLDIN